MDSSKDEVREIEQITFEVVKRLTEQACKVPR